jgi:hypothetical protein
MSVAPFAANGREPTGVSSVNSESDIECREKLNLWAERDGIAGSDERPFLSSLKRGHGRIAIG